MQIDIPIIDDFLNSITMYRLTLYYLILLLIVAFIYSFFGIMPFSWFSLLFSSIFIITICYLSNKLFKKIFKVQTNIESNFITALILACIITPGNLILLFSAGVLAMASKYILNIKGKHIFNPTAIAVFITGILFRQYASWWIATKYMLPFLFLGILIPRKIRRFDLVFYFFISAIVSTFFVFLFRGNANILAIAKNIFTESPIFFFAFVMLTEPLTTPPTNSLQSIYGFLTGIFFAPIHIFIFYTSPEIALLIGNIFSWLSSSKQKLILKLKEKIRLTPTIYDFIFETPEKLQFIPGQYFEWTFEHKNTDSRGNRRYFTIASSPTEKDVRVGIKFEPEKGSSYKREMLNMKMGDKIVISSLNGDLILPKNNPKVAFIAGGIGITPFRSIIKYLLDTNEKRDIVLLYSEKTKETMVYKEIFEEAERRNLIKVIYFETNSRGHMEKDSFKKEIPDYNKRLFYISGSHKVVTAFEGILKDLNIPSSQIKTDYFPGF